MSPTLPAVRRGYVVSHPELGVFLGQATGLGFWSNLDPLGAEVAVAFDSHEDGQRFIALHLACCSKERAEDFVVTDVEVDENGDVQMAEIVRVGLPAWDPLDRRPHRAAASPADDPSFDETTMDGPFICKSCGNHIPCRRCAEEAQ